ncbi:hypothetical protein PINS_up001788 [Pythium insidiosum]|nr:hypothetical protein PINS_up001788 [Pythium insidiosum]
MNYLTAIIATPLFLCIWLFELRLFWTSSPNILREGKDIVGLAYASSTLQMISCWFWLFGFALGKTDNVLSEAKGADEYGNCFGLVGAEVLLSIFQYLTTMYTLLQMFVVRFVYTSSAAWRVSAFKRSRRENVVLVVVAILGLCYLPIAWITAWNRRCPQGTPVWPAIQHYFYSTFLIVDAVTSSFSLYYARDIQRRLEIKSSVSTTTQEAGGGKSKEGSSESKVSELARFFQFQCKMTLVGVFLAASFFILQFGIEIKALSVVACMFCTIMYTVYALRRVPMLMKYLRDDHSWLPRTWAIFWNTRYRSPLASYTVDRSSTGAPKVSSSYRPSKVAVESSSHSQA